MLLISELGGWLFVNCILDWACLVSVIWAFDGVRKVRRKDIGLGIDRQV